MISYAMTLAILGVAALATAAPATVMASTDGGAENPDMPRLVITTACTIYADQLDRALTGMDAILGTGLGAHVPVCEVTTEYLGPAPSVAVDIPEGTLYPKCADDDSCFDPHTATVGVGDTIVWTNSDTVLHTVTEVGGEFDGWLLPGEEFAVTFDTPGTHVYGCVVHPWAGGVVVVEQDTMPEPAGIARDDVPEPVRVVEDLIAMYDMEGAAAFNAVNVMVSEDIYPFAINAETMTVVAEGAFPQAVGLPATFLHDADRPLTDILSELETLDGTWAKYAFLNPLTASYEDKTSYLVLHDGHIFGSGYYTSPDSGATDAVDAMLRLYDTVGEDAFADVVSVPTDGLNVPFVLDAGTLEVVAHADPNISGGDVRDAIISGQSAEFVHDMLDRHGSLWLSYPSADPVPGAEYTRTYMVSRDGYAFASGYGVDTESRLQSLVDESVRLYDRDGDAAFDIITSMSTTSQLVYDVNRTVLEASSITPQYVGLKIPYSIVVVDQGKKEALRLYDQGGAWSDRLLSNTEGVELRQSSWSVIHDGLLFIARDTYSPEAVAVAEVNAAIGLYDAYGEGAFDRITWQSVDPAIVYPFVFDAETWRAVAHAAYPDRLGMVPASIMADNDLDEISEALAESEGVWVSYNFYNPITNLVEYKRTWLAQHDGYIFAAGYYYGNFDRAESIIAEAIAGYDTSGEAAFEAINAEMSGSMAFSPIVLDYDMLDVVAHGGYPGLVGQNIDDIVASGDVLAASIRANLVVEGDSLVTVSAVVNPQTGLHVRQSMILQLHDGYIFAVVQPAVTYTR